MNRSYLAVLAGLLLASTAPPADAQTPTCDGLSGSQEFLAAQLLATQRVYDCCDDTIANCLGKNPTCSPAFRLSENVCRRVAEGQPRARIIEALQMRARNARPRDAKAEIDLTGLPVAGEASAPITLVEYAWAEAVGMDREAFQKAMDDPAVRQSLVEIKKEGFKNGVESTPTFFIDGRKYDGELSHEELIDVLEEEFEKIGR